MEADPKSKAQNDVMQIVIVPLNHPEQPLTEEEQCKIEERLLKQFLTSDKLPGNLTFRSIYFKPGQLVIRSSHLETTDWVKEVVAKTTLMNYPLKIESNIETETCYDAFYHAIRSGNVKLLDTLIDHWPNKYFTVHFKELDEILSETYEELKLKNVPLSDEMEIFIENKLINLRFFSNAPRQNQGPKAYFNNIRERIDLVLQKIQNLLNEDYSSSSEVNETFLFVAKFVAQNIHILKRQLKSTYDKLPWEEMEFCLVSFISSYMKQKDTNLFYNAILSKSKLLNQLGHFASKLKDVKNLIGGVNAGKFSDLPKIRRERVVAAIVNKNPEFEQLYSDYQQIRDIVSLEKISDYIKLALSADPKQREGQIIITRVLQVIGEYLKNTLESPKLSSSISELLLLSLPRNTRDVLIDLRNSLSHAYSLSKRTEIEENADANFFIGVQNDTKVIDNAITDILFHIKIKILRLILKKIANCKTPDDMTEIASLFINVKLGEMIAEGSNLTELEKLDQLIKELSYDIREKTDFENELFDKIDQILRLEKTKSKNFKNDYVTSFQSLLGFGISLKDEEKINDNFIRSLKFFANVALQNMPSTIEPDRLKQITELSMQICNSARTRIEDNDDRNELSRITWEIFHMAQLGTADLKWIEGLRDQLYARGSFTIHKQKETYYTTEANINSQLEGKLSELKNILKDNSVIGQLTENLHSYKKNKKLQAVVEMLVLDVLSILGGSEKQLENNLLFLDDKIPLLTGKSLRNHLAHDNGLLDVLLSDPSMALILNAKKLVSENVTRRRIGKFVRDDPSKLKEKFDQNLATIINQEKMFAALEEGNLEVLKSCLSKGADIKARSLNCSTALHFAARSANVEIIKFITDQKLDVNVKNVDGQSSLHISAAHGRENVLKFFIKEKGVCIDDKDESGKTALHIAAKYGHKHFVEILLRNMADSNTKDKSGLSPLQYAIQNNHLNVAKIMFKREANVDSNEVMGGFTSLHIAAEFGHLKLVEFLLENGANVNAKNDREGIPIHTSALNGHLEIVKALIRKGSDVNARVINGCSPLHYAVENGHEEVASVILKHGANVNVVDKTYGNSPLHCAAKDGHEKIVDALLAKKANARLASVAGTTPLHLAAGSGHLKIVAALLEHGVNIRAKDKSNHSPLHHACMFGHTLVAELLIKRGADVNDRDNNDLTPLHQAALNGKKDVVELLVKNKADIRARDIEGNTSLHAAAKNGSKEIIELLLKNNADIEITRNDGLTALHLASAGGHKDATTFLIKNGAQVNACAVYGVTPLHGAIELGHDDIVQLLIQNGAQVNLKGAKCAPLLAAVIKGSKDIMRTLIANGANVNTENSTDSLLLAAVKRNHKEIVEILIENGASVNEDRGAPLFMAVLFGFKDVVEVLLKHKANVNVKGQSRVQHCILLLEKASRG